MKKKGFTLAEVLITIGIIGVVATLTIPSLVSNYRKKVYVTQLQRSYNEVSNALMQLMAEENVDSLSESSLGNGGAYNFITNYLRIKKTGSDAFAGNYTGIGGYGSYSYNSLGAGYSDGGTCAVMNTGAGICITDFKKGYGYGQIVVDTNGKGGPNVYGRDLFAFKFYNNGEVGSAQGSSYSYSYGGSDSDYLDRIIGDGWKMYY